MDTDGHIPRNWFHNRIWEPALKKAKIDLKVHLKDLRHAHASWLLAGGADLQVVKERLGHGSIRTTPRTISTLSLMPTSRPRRPGQDQETVGEVMAEPGTIGAVRIRAARPYSLEYSACIGSRSLHAMILRT